MSVMDSITERYEAQIAALTAEAAEWKRVAVAQAELHGEEYQKLTAENARLREGITQYKEFFQKHQAAITGIVLSEDGINKLVIGEAAPKEASNE